MAHIYRFFGQRDEKGLWRIDDEDVNHALKVLRLQDGALIEVMDGNGYVASGALQIISKSKVAVQVAGEHFTPKDVYGRKIILGALKPGDVDDLISPLVELGVDDIVVFRQEGTPQFRIAESAHERWERLIRSALKQCKRPWGVSISAVEHLSDAIDNIPGDYLKVLLAAEASCDLMSLFTSGGSKKGAVMLIGGEKGLTSAEEAKALSCGFEPARLGPWVLRARTAAPAAAVFLGLMPRKP